MNRFNRLTLAVAATLATASSAFALQPKDYSAGIRIPERAVIVTGDSARSRHLVAVLYDTEEFHFSDPSAPRFLFLDREGKVALGIGGRLKGTLQYDFGGAIDDGASFIPFDIPVPQNPAQRNQFYGNANHSQIFLQLVGHSKRFGYYQMYIQTEFSNDGSKRYGLKLKQGYLTVGYVTAGLASSTFVDGSVGTPVIDDQGPAGEMCRKNVLLRYAPRFNNHFSGAIAAEMPPMSMTPGEQVTKINQRVPDIPLYVQYQYGKAKNHVRVSALLRNLSYRDDAAGKNRFATGWAVQLSGKQNIYGGLTFLYQGAYGAGYGSYLNDLSGNGLDLVPSATPGKMHAQRTASFELGLRYNVTPSLMLSGTYSQARILKQGQLPATEYHFGQYIAASAFYSLTSELQIGLEYLRGQRNDFSGESAHANRIMGLVQFSF